MQGKVVIMTTISEICVSRSSHLNNVLFKYVEEEKPIISPFLKCFYCSAMKTHLFCDNNFLFRL